MECSIKIKKTILVISVIILIVLSSVILFFLSKNGIISDYKYTLNRGPFKFTITLTEYVGDKEEVRIPGRIGLLRVAFIEPEVFNDNADITHIYVSKNVNMEGTLFCRRMPNLVYVEFEEGLETVSAWFVNSKNLKEIKLPQSVEDVVLELEGCDQIKGIDYPKNVKRINAPGIDGTPFKNKIKSYKYYVIGSNVLLSYNGSENEIVIPQGIKVLPAFVIPDDSETVISAIYMPESLTYMALPEIANENTMLYVGSNELEVYCTWRKYAGTIVAPAGSPMEMYCKENDIKFRPMTDEEEKIWREKTEAAASEITYQE